ncbi:hypothetical protein ABTX81_05545 [Kitasatospora sp. NPDC097605]|uniref:hypothetical protein n=1 Tax=Kitasatospora sp. NPDC097605 TaxID=3157226 RepID=UPI003329096C
MLTFLALHQLWYGFCGEVASLGGRVQTGPAGRGGVWDGDGRCPAASSTTRTRPVPCNQFDHHGPQHTIHGPLGVPVFTIRRTWLADDGCEPITEGWGQGADLEMNQNEARDFAAQLRNQANRIDEEAQYLAAVGSPQADNGCRAHPWCEKGGEPHPDCESVEITLEAVDSRNPGRGRPYLSAHLATYDGEPTCGMLLDNWTDLNAADLRRVIDDIESYLPKLRILASQLAEAEVKSRAAHGSSA